MAITLITGADIIGRTGIRATHLALGGLTPATQLKPMNSHEKLWPYGRWLISRSLAFLRLIIRELNPLVDPGMMHSIQTRRFQDRPDR